MLFASLCSFLIISGPAMMIVGAIPRVTRFRLAVESTALLSAIEAPEKRAARVVQRVYEVERESAGSRRS